MKGRKGKNAMAVLLILILLFPSLRDKADVVWEVKLLSL